MFQFVSQAQKNQNNPQEIFKQITEKYTPEQKKQFNEFAKGFGITDEQLKQYGIYTK